MRNQADIRANNVGNILRRLRNGTMAASLIQANIPYITLLGTNSKILNLNF